MVTVNMHQEYSVAILLEQSGVNCVDVVVSLVGGLPSDAFLATKHAPTALEFFLFRWRSGGKPKHVCKKAAFPCSLRRATTQNASSNSADREVWKSRLEMLHRGEIYRAIKCSTSVTI
jgi:hypothetical protein